MFNTVILMGRIAHDLELKTTASGIPVLSFRLAVDRTYQSKGEEKKTDFINIVAWRSNAEFIHRYFGKGRMILINGELQTRQYVDKNNITQYISEVIVSSASFTGELKTQNQPNKPPYQNQQSNAQQNFVDNADDPNDNDYPF